MSICTAHPDLEQGFDQNISAVFKTYPLEIRNTVTSTDVYFGGKNRSNFGLIYGFGSTESFRLVAGLL